jgi:hypothetical protein
MTTMTTTTMTTTTTTTATTSSVVERSVALANEAAISHVGLLDAARVAVLESHSAQLLLINSAAPHAAAHAAPDSSSVREKLSLFFARPSDRFAVCGPARGCAALVWHFVGFVVARRVE